MDDGRTYLVEHYRPGATVGDFELDLARILVAAEALSHEGSCVRIVRSTIVPGDEAFLSVVEAASELLVRLAFERAGVALERISPALTYEREELE
jgi:hypothetical protein